MHNKGTYLYRTLTAPDHAAFLPRMNVRNLRMFELVKLVKLVGVF